MHNLERILSSLGFALWIAVATWWLNHNAPFSELYRFGWEYGKIAAALAEGRGFSDAMGPGSGPTAWMPPLLPILYATIFAVAGVKTSAAAVLCCALRSLAGGLCLYWLQGWCTGPWTRRMACLLALAALSLDRLHSLCDLNDAWLINLGLCAVVSICLRLQQPSPMPTFYYFLAALIPMLSPVLTLVLALGLVLQAGQRKKEVLALGLACLVPCLLWGMRHRLVLGQFYPIKSNLWFDFVEANLLDDDGILTTSTVYRFHPIRGGPSGQSYRRLGEREFVEQARQHSAQVNGTQWRTRCWRRFLNASWRLQPERDFALASNLQSADLEGLANTDLLMVSKGIPFWTFMYRDSAQMLANSSEPQRTLWMNSRMQAEIEFWRHQESWDVRVWSYAFTLLPTLASLMLALSGCRDKTARVCLLCYWTFLTPYILVQHYARYQVSAIFVQIYLILAAARLVKGWIRRN